MQEVPSGRFQRLRCASCGAHALVRSTDVPGVRCEVCGSPVLVPVEVKPPPDTAASR